MSSFRPNTAAPEQLLEQAGWILQLARSLAGDAHRADDLAQDTWTRMLAHPPTGDRPIRGWIATVMRNAWRHDRRGEARRGVRERTLARSESVDEQELLDRVALHREIAEAVLSLREPYRQAILQRYFDGQSARRIAQTQGIPLSTVKTRLVRGLAQLRSRLDANHGHDGRSWLVALVPLLRQPVPPWPVSLSISLGALALNTKIAITVAALAVVGTTYFIYGSSGAPAPAPSTVDAASTSVSVPMSGGDSEPLVAGTTSRVRSAVEAESVGERPDTEVSMVRGRVLDVRGRILGGVQVVGSDGAEPEAVDGSEGVRAEGDGRFAMSLGDAQRRLFVVGPQFTTVLAGMPVIEARGMETVVVAAPRLEFGGRVVDKWGAPIANATVELKTPANLRVRIGTVLDHSASVVWQARSDAEGAFAFGALPALEGATLLVDAAGFARRSDPGPMRSNTAALLALERVDASRYVEGLVLDQAGVPVEDALVSMGIDTTRSDRLGRFEFPLDAAQTFNKLARGHLDVDAARLIAVKSGFLPAELVANDTTPAGEPVWPERIELRLGGPALSIDGIVVDENGQPRPGVRVWVADPTFFGGLGDPASGGFPQLVHVESMVAGRDPGWSWAETDEDGGFRIDGLLARPYVIQAMDPASLLRVERTEVKGGQSGVRVVLSNADAYETLRGRVVDARGAPVAQVDVIPMCDAFQTKYGGRTVSTRHHTASGTTTDESGRFELKSVPKNLAYLRLDSPSTVPLEWGRHVVGGLAQLVGETHDDVVITVGLRCHFAIQLDDPLEADEIEVLDGVGAALEISEFVGNGRRESRRQALSDGRAGTLGVADTARTVVLYRSGDEVRRIALALIPGERVVVR